MRSVVVSAHNPMTGPRHLGHYASTMIDWLSLQREHELFIVIDDLIASILYPRARKEIQNRTFQVAKEFIATGIDLDENHIVLTSMLPEVHELVLFTSMAFDHSWCCKLHQESFAGLLDSYQRRELRLPRHPSVAEIVYPQLHLASLTLGLRTDFFQGGEEMRGYFSPMEVIVEQYGGKGLLKVPSLLTTKCTFFLGTDGKHMGSENAIYLSESEEEIAKYLSGVPSTDIFGRWCLALNQEELAARIYNEAKTDEALESGARLMTKFLSQELAKFRESKTSNQEIAAILEKSSIVARERIRETLIEIKGDFGIPGFLKG